MSIAHSIKDTVRTDDVLITESVDFSGLLLSKHVLQGLTEAGFKRPSPIQLKAIPLGRCGLDLIVQAKSGTGKTCVFTVVALEGLELKSVCVQVLVLAPTREIALQVQDVIQTIGKPMKGLKCHPFIGGLPLDVDKTVAKSCHIAVGTPGRVRQLIEIGAMKTNSVRMFILDEADKLLEEGFQETINWIYATLPQNKQILALSATYPDQLAQHLTSYMRNPTFVRLNTTDPALLGIKQYHFVVANHPMPNVVFGSKIEAVVKILSSVSFQQCLIFSNLQTGAQNLQSELVSRNWPTTCIAGFLGQKERNLAMEQLKTYKCRILISTDLTSRGIDADKVNLVINLDVPLDHETYLHRIGRAGRFGSFGAAVTIVTKGAQETQLWAVEKKCHTHIHRLPVPIPNDLVTKPVPLRIDDIVSTEQIINQPASEASSLIEAASRAVVSNHLQETVSSSDTHMVTQHSEQNRQSSEERTLPSKGDSIATERDTAVTHEIQAELSKADPLELTDKHVSDVDPMVVEEGNCECILEPGPLLLHEAAKISTAETEFRPETIAGNFGKCQHEIPAENGDIPAENGDIPAENSDIPAENGDIPAENGDIPAENGDIPAEIGDIPAEIGDIPAENGDIPAENSNVPAENSNVPAENSNVPAENGDVPAENGDIPDANGDVPAENSNVPAENGDIPAENSNVPAENDDIPAENSDNCMQEVNSNTFNNDNYEILKGNCNESKCDTSTGVSNFRHDIGPDNNLEAVNVDLEEMNSVNGGNEKPAVQTSNSALNLHEDLAVASQSNEGLGDECRDLEPELVECLETSRHESVGAVESDNCLASLDIVKCEGVQLPQKSNIHDNIENSGSCTVQHHSSTDNKSSLCDEDKTVLETDTGEENKGRVIRTDVSEYSKDSDLINSLSTVVNVLHKTEPLQEAVVHDVSKDVTKTASVSTSVSNKAESVCISTDGGVGNDGLVSEKVLMVCSGISSIESNVKEDCDTLPCDKYVKSEAVSSLATINAEQCSHRDYPISVSEVPALDIPDKCIYSKPSSGEVAENNTRTHTPDRLPVKFRKPGIRRRYVKPFAVSEFLQYLNEGNSCYNSEETSYPFNDSDEESLGDSQRIVPANIGTSVHDPMPYDLNGGGDFVVASSCLPSRQHTACETSHNEVVKDNKESSYLRFDVLGGGDSIVSGSLHEQSANISDVDILGGNTSKSQISVSGHETAVEHSQASKAENGIQPVNAENGTFNSTNNIVNEPVCESSPQTVCNTLPSAPSQTVHKSTNILLIECLSSLLLSSHRRLPKFSDLEADHKQFCSDFDNSMVVSCASELMTNLVLEDFKDPKDVQELCAVESAKLALLKSTLKSKLLNAEEKRKADLPIEERVKLKKGFSGDKQMHQTNKHSDYSRGKTVHETSEQDIDETGRTQQKARKGYRGKNKSGKGRKGSDSLNWRRATDENYYDKSAGDGHNFSPRKEIQKPQRKKHSNLNEELNPATWKRDCSNADMGLNCTDDLTPNQSQLSECHSMLGKHDREANKLVRQDETIITESTQGGVDEDAKQKQMQPSDQKDDECKMLDNMHAQMLLKRKLRKLEREHLSGADVPSHTEVTKSENTEGGNNKSAEQLHVQPSERTDSECKILDNMHEQMLLKRKLKKLERQFLSCGNEQSNSCAVEVAALSKDEETKILKTVDKHTEDVIAPTLTENTLGCKVSNKLLDIEGNIVLVVVLSEENANAVDENHRMNSNPEIKEKDESRDAENMLSRKSTLSGEQSKQKPHERDKLVKFKRESTASSHRKPTKPSKSEARLAGLKVSDGSTSTTSDLSLSSASDISDVNSSDVDTKDVILASQCYANKYAQEGYLDPRYGKPNKKAVAKTVPVCPAYSTQRDNILQDSASLPETEHSQHKDNLTPSLSSVPLQDSHSIVFHPGDQYDHQPYLIDNPITEHPVKSGLKGEKLKDTPAEQNRKFQHPQKSNSAERKASGEHDRENTMAKDHKLSRNSKHHQKVVRHDDEFSGSDSEDMSSDSSENDSHSFVTHHPNLYSYHNAMPWFPPYGGMHQSMPQFAYPTASYVHSMQPLALPYYGPFPLSYTHPIIYQGSQPLAYNYPQPAFQWYTPSSQTMWYYVSHMTNMMSHLLKKHTRKMESKRERRRVSREE